MIINIFGSTGIIGKKTLDLIDRNFPQLKVNLLCAESNINQIIKQIKKYKPNYVYLDDIEASNRLRVKVNKKIKILSSKELNIYLKKSSSDLTILAISGYKSLYFFDQITNNTKNLGIVSKEVIVSAGHILRKKKYFKKTNIFPLDSEHFSIFNYSNSFDLSKKVKEVILTASGGPFYKKKFKELKNTSFEQAIKHPKWKMGYKNSIDSATLVNKCLEIVEAHYLFNIPYKKLKIKIHPDAIIHSIIINENFVACMNLFKNDMTIPLINFLKNSKLKPKIKNENLHYNSYKSFEFFDVKSETFPIYKYFDNLDKSKPSNIIKFNVGNEFAVNLFKNNKIKYTDIYKIIKKVCSLNLYSPLKDIKDIIKYHEKIENKISIIFKNYI